MPGQIIIRRAFCRFSRFDLKTIPVKRREQALQLQLRQWSPFPQSEFAIVFEQDAALVWCWDATWMQLQRKELAKPWHAAQAIPESLFFQPTDSGVRFLTCMDGVEAQFWQNRELHASRWWSQTPSLEEFIAFCREVGHPVDQMTKLPVAQAPVLQTQPWLPVISGGSLTASNAVWEHWLYAALFLCVALPYSWYALREHQFKLGIEQNKREMIKLTGQANSLVQERETALKAVEEITRRQQLDPYPTQLELMTAVAEALPSDSSIREWEFQENKLRIVIAGGLEMPSRADITNTLIKSGYFTDVQNLLARDNKSLSFRMTVALRKGVVMPQETNVAEGKDKNG